MVFFEFLVFMKVSGATHSWKLHWTTEGVSQKNSCHRKNCEGAFLVFRKDCVSKNFICKGGITTFVIFLSTFPEKFVDEPFGVSESFWYRTTLYIGGKGVSRFSHELFFVEQCRKKFVEDTFWCLWLLSSACYRLCLHALKYYAQEKSRQFVVILKIIKKQWQESFLIE